MRAFLALLAFLTQAGVHVEPVAIPMRGGVTLDAALVLPAGVPNGPSSGPLRPAAVVALHGCGGPFPSRDGSWAVLLARAGHIVLLPDSFGSRGLGSQCRVKRRTMLESRERRADAIAAAEWLMHRPGTPPGGIDLIGWSNGGGTTLHTANAGRDLPRGLFRRFVAFYPGCRTLSRNLAWRPAGPLMILVGAADDWTPAAPCGVLAARFPHQVTFIAYPGAYHDFDAPDRPAVERHGLATPPSGTGRAHTGTNEPARQDAVRRVLAFVDKD